MEFDKKFYKNEFKKLLKLENEHKFFIKKSNSTFKIDKFIRKSRDSFDLAEFIKKSKQNGRTYWTITICYYSMLYIAKAAILTKGYETDDHYSTQIALGHLMVPNEIEREDFELLEMTHKLFESDYVDYFEDARKESSISRYSATKVYDEKRVDEVLENARKFIKKIEMIIADTK